MIQIISDSTSDIPKELLEQFQIDILPLHILLGEEEYRDGVNITPDEIYRWSDANKTTPKTSAPSMEDAINLFRPHLEAGKELICFSISETMSASANVMRLAAEELGAEDRVHVINSKSLCNGIALLVLEAAKMAQDGASAQEIVAAIEELIPRVQASFVVDTLVYLHRGGRCGGLAAMAGSVMKLHPRIALHDGVMSPGKKYRGSIDKVVLSYVKDMEEDLKKAKSNRIFIVHSGIAPEIKQSVREYLESLDHFDEILESRAGGVISSHCGPGTLGVMFLS